MKKIIIMAILSFAASISISAQNADLQKWANKAEGNKSLSTTTKAPNVVREAGIYLEKSAKYQYAAIIISTVGTGLGMTSAIFDDKSIRNGFIIGGGACVVAALCCQIASINYKMKAGRNLRLYSTGTGGGLAYTF